MLKFLTKENIDLINNLYKEGASDTEVKARLGISHSIFRTSYETNDFFKKLIDHGRLIARAWWEQQGRINLDNRHFNHNLWYQNMKNRWGWSDKSNSSDDKADVSNMDREALDDKIERLTKKQANSTKEKRA